MYTNFQVNENGARYGGKYQIIALFIYEISILSWSSYTATYIYVILYYYGLRCTFFVLFFFSPLKSRHHAAVMNMNEFENVRRTYKFSKAFVCVYMYADRYR